MQSPSIQRKISQSTFQSSSSSHINTPVRSPDHDLRALELSESFVDDDIQDRPNLSREGEQPGTAVHGDEKHVGVLHGMALVVGMQVGSGIFSSPGVIVAEVGSTGASLMVWILSGILAWTGAR